MTVRRSRAPGPAVPDLTPPPEPALGPRPAVCRVHLSGVGGMGIGVVGRILIEAAAEEWPAVEVFHRKGLAQRGGGVFSHVTMHDGAEPRPAEIPEGTADLVLGPGAPRGGARPALRLGRPDGRAMDTHRRPTTMALTGRRAYPDDLVERANAETRPGGLVATDFSAAAKRRSGDRSTRTSPCWGPPGSAAGSRWAGRRSRARSPRRRRPGRGQPARLPARAGSWRRARRTPPGPRTPRRSSAARRAGSGRGASAAPSARASSARATAGLGEVAMRMLAPRLPEIVAWGGAGYAERYLGQVDRVRRLRRP